MDVTPIIPAGRQVIESYGSDGFRISGVLHAGAVLVFPDRTVAWPAASLAELSADSFAPVAERGGIEILLLGCGRRAAPVPPSWRSGLRSAGIVLDAMDTGAACRTYNVLLAEGRRVAAALLPP